MLPILQNQSPSLVAFFILVALYAVYQLTQYLIIFRRRSIIKCTHGCKPIPSYPHVDRFLGLDIFLETARLSSAGGLVEAFNARYYQMNSWTYTSLFMSSRQLNTIEPENIKALLATQFKDFTIPKRRTNAAGPVFGHGIFMTDGKEWEESRAMLRPNFTRGQIADLDMFESHITKLIARIPQDGSTVDLQPLFFMLTIDSATEFLFGQSTDILGGGELGPSGERFSQAFNTLTEKIGKRARLGKFAFLLPDRKFEEDKVVVHAFIRDYVEKGLERSRDESWKEKANSGKYIFLDALVKQGLPAQKIQDELLNILLAGRDTTASLLSFVFYILARRPDVWKKLREEILTIGDKKPSYEDIKGMKYLSYVLNETLRLHPIVPANFRVAVRDTTLPVGGGPDGKSPIFIPKGMVCGYHVYAMHRRTDLYGEDALDFKPERWEKLRPSWQYLPFNGGPRICIGQQFALVEASYTTIRILQAFTDIERRDNSKLTDLMTLTMAVRPGTKVGLIPA